MQCFRNQTAWPGALLAALLVAGCGSSAPVPRAEIAASETAVRQAERIGAQEYAPLALRRAQQKLAEAAAAIDEEENERARRLAEQALVDAELAQVSTLSAQAQEELADVQARIQALQEEIARRQPPGGQAPQN